MRSISDKVNNEPAPSGVLEDDEWNDRNTELENATTDSGQTLSVLITNQLSRAIGMGGKRTLLSSGTLEPGQTALVDNSIGSVTINLPASPATNETVHFEPTSGNLYSDFALTVGANGSTIETFGADMTVGVLGNTVTDNLIFSMRFDSSTWRVLFIGKIGV